MLRRLRLRIRGAVQGVGFRPFVFRLARDLGLAGSVWNDNRGVVIEVEAEPEKLEAFQKQLREQLPPRAAIHELRTEDLEAQGDEGFSIAPSDLGGSTTAVVLPDLATCSDCLREVGDPDDRRYRYPFTNCTNCGPRFSIIEGLPYDRPNTTMRLFEMCERCRSEYEDPFDRRFHAQPNACPTCGPRLELTTSHGSRQATEDEALVRVAQLLRAGAIVAVKGLGGFHLLVDAAADGAVQRLREKKQRPHKPLALMVSDLTMARRICSVDPASAELLESPEAPIVLLPRLAEAPVSASVAPGIQELGLMLPPTPLHHLLIAEVDRPVVATSGNLSDEPICTDNEEALNRLGTIAQYFLLHDRAIARHVDDSVLRWTPIAPRLLRRARGLAPLPIRLPRKVPTLLAVGPHQKCTVALSVGDRVFLSQHIGDMETPQAREAFERVVRDFLRLYEAIPVAIVHDLHPDYPTTRWALAAGREGVGPSVLADLPRIAVQHHHAHLASCLAENGLENESVLGVTFDGTGYGTDGTIWGGEFLLGSAADYRRVGRLRSFRLPGGEAAIREPLRTAVSLLRESGLDPATAIDEIPERLRLLDRLLERGFRSPETTSAGRLFDGVAALAGARRVASFEGQAAMELEQLADPHERGTYPLPVGEDPERILVLDWAPLVRAVVKDSQSGVAPGIISTRFHHALADAIVVVARTLEVSRVALTGGCFQNRLLTECTHDRLTTAGFSVLLHREVPANDGGIALGQVAVAAARLAGRESSACV